MLKLCVIELWNCVCIAYKLSWLHCLFVSELLVPPLRHTSDKGWEFHFSSNYWERVKDGELRALYGNGCLCYAEWQSLPIS